MSRNALSLRVSDELADNAEAYLARTPQSLLMLHEDAERWVETEALNVSKASRRQHFEAIAFAYALFIRSVRNPDFRREILPKFAAMKGRKITPQTDPLRIIVETMVTYGIQSNEERRRTRGLYSRDVQAIRYLQATGVTPSEVVRLSAGKGEGLDSWSRKYSALSKESGEETPDAEGANALGPVSKGRPDVAELNFIMMCVNSFFSVGGKQLSQTRALSSRQATLVEGTATLLLQRARKFTATE